MSWVIKKSSRQLKTRGLGLDGVDEYVVVPDDPSLNPTEELSIEVLVNLQDYPDLDHGGFIKKFKSSSHCWWFWIAKGGPGTDFTIRNEVTGEGVSVGYALTLKKWHHIIATASKEAVRVFVDGELVGEEVGITIPNLTGYRIEIAKGYDYTPTLIALIRIYNRALSLREIEKLYAGENITKGLVLYLPFDEGRSKVAIDRSGFNNNGILYGNPRWQVKSLEPVLSLSMDEIVRDHVLDSTIFGNHGRVYGAKLVDGKSKKALDFDGINDYVDCGNEIKPTNQITLGAWVKLTALNTRQCIIKKTRVTDNVYGFMLGVNDDNKIAFYIYTDTWHGAWSFTTSVINTNWHHIMATWDGSFMKVYIDAVQDPSTMALTGTMAGATVPTWIGMEPFANGSPFSGIIDEVQVYDRALSPREIKTLYQSYIHPEF